MSDSAQPVVATAEPTATEAPKTETTETKPAETPVQPPTSKQLLDLAKKEAEFARKEVARKSEIAKLQSEYEAAQQELKLFKEFKNFYRQDPEKVLAKLGVTFDELTDAVIEYHQSKNSKPKEVNVDDIKREIEEKFRMEQEERQAAETAKVIETFYGEIGNYVQENSEKLPYLTSLHKPMGETDTPQELIFQIIDEHYKATNEVIDVEAAAQVAEDYFREEWEKLNGRLTRKPAEAKPVETPAATQSEPKTVSNTEPKQLVASEAKSMEFKVRDYSTPTSVSNNFSKPKVKVPYNPQKAERKDAIARAVEALEQGSRRAR